MPTVTLIDNYDSFTCNLVHYLGALGADVTVHRNDKVSVAEVMAAGPDAIVLSPGPCTPKEAGICLDLIARREREDSDLRRLPRPSGDRRGLWRRSRARAAAHARQARRHPPYGRDDLSRHQRPVPGDALSFARRRARDACPTISTITAETGRAHHGAVAHSTARRMACSSIPRASPPNTATGFCANFLDLAAAWNQTQRGR